MSLRTSAAFFASSTSCLLDLKAALYLNTTMGRDAWGLLRDAKAAGLQTGLSIGFIAKDWDWDVVLGTGQTLNIRGRPKGNRPPVALLHRDPEVTCAAPMKDLPPRSITTPGARVLIGDDKYRLKEIEFESDDEKPTCRIVLHKAYGQAITIEMPSKLFVNGFYFFVDRWVTEEVRQLHADNEAREQRKVELAFWQEVADAVG